MNIRKCKHCNVEFDISDKPSGWMANHSRWCNENPKRQDYVDKLNVPYSDWGSDAVKGWHQVFFYDPEGNVIEVHQLEK